MGFTLTIKGEETIHFTKEVTAIHVDINTPLDSRAKSSNASATMWVTGKLFAAEPEANGRTLKLFDWALVPAKSEKSYRSVVAVIKIGGVYRKIEFPNAFVIDYNERHNDVAGAGEFRLILRQKADKLDDIKATPASDTEYS